MAAASCSSPPPSGPESWESRLGRTVEIEGEAENRKMGAAVGDLWVDGDVPPGMNGKQVRVRGILTRRDDLPVFVPDPKEDAKAGIPVPKGTDLEKARRRYVITKPTWTLLDPNPPSHQ